VPGSARPLAAPSASLATRVAHLLRRRRCKPAYPKPGNGRPPVGVERMLRIHFLQRWFDLSDPAVEEALYDSRAMRGFVGIDLGREPVPDETTVCRFRHLLEQHGLARLAGFRMPDVGQCSINGGVSSPAAAVSTSCASRSWPRYTNAIDTAPSKRWRRHTRSPYPVLVKFTNCNYLSHGVGAFLTREAAARKGVFTFVQRKISRHDSATLARLSD
jgi:hypothetical protein